MNLAKFSQQLLRDMKASAAKTGVLGLLLLVGLYFWVPPLLKAFSGGTPAEATASTTTTTSTSTPNASATSKKPRDSAAITKLLHEHPLLQAVSAEEMPEKPFGLNDDLIPLPVLIEKDSLAESLPPPVKPKPKPIEKLDGLSLKSTLVGPTRRAALINNRLYQEGQTIPWNDKQLRLESVTRKSVTLTDGVQSWQLKLDNSRSESEE